jgi:NitT/TauT family transport system ATP-binding protein
MSKGVEVIISNLNVSFRTENEQLEVIKNLSMKIQTGEYVVILGPSGCGKSTLLRLLAGTLQRLIPSVEINGKVEIRVGQGDIEYRISLAPQSYTLVPWRTVMENVLFPNILTGNKIKDNDKERASQLLEMFGIGAFSETYPHELSGGIAQRASLARALFADSDLLLLDEPLNAVDLYERERIQTTLRSHTQERGITTIHVTHDIYEAAFVASRIFLMTSRPGEIGDVKELSQSKRDLQFRESKEYNELVAKLRMAFHSWKRSNNTCEDRC